MADTRPFGLTLTPTGERFTPVLRSSEGGYTVFRFAEERTVLLHVSCPLARCWDDTCTQVLASPEGKLDAEEQAIAEELVADDVAAAVAGLKVACPVHGAPLPRPAREYRDADGRLLTSVKVDETLDGYVTHKCVGDPAGLISVSCTKAPEWNHRCRSVEVGTISAGLAGAALASKQLAVAQQLVGLVITMRTQGCPEHDPATATPNVLDGLLASLTPERIRQLKDLAEAALNKS